MSSPETLPWSCRNCGHRYTVDDVTYPSLPQHLTTTNNPPLQQEFLDLKDTLDAVDFVKEVAALDTEIASLLRTLDALHARRAKMETRVRACKSITSPLRRFPAELILEIMDWATCVANGIDTVERETVSWYQTGIWVYSQVCQRWRAIALSTPAFWSKLSIHLDAYTPPVYKQVIPSIHRLEMILSRSADHLLSLKFYLSYTMTDYDYNPTIATAHHLLVSLVKHSERWYNASLTLPCNSLNQLRSVQNRIPNLQCLTLQVDDDNDFVQFLSVDDADIRHFRNAPALRKVEFEIPSMMSLSIPWSQITECSVLSDANFDFLSKVRVMHGLTSLVICWQDLQDEDSFQDGPLPIVLSSLRKLEVMSSRGLVSNITLPALQELKVHITQLGPVTALIQRSGCRITELDFFPNDRDETSDPSTLQFLRVIASVSVVDLSGEPVSNIFQLCKFLVSPEEHDCLLPSLTKLILPRKLLVPPVDRDADPIDADPTNPIGLVIRFLRQRRDPQFISLTTRAIESVVFVGFGDPQPLSLFPELQSLERDGLHILFKSVKVD